MLLIHSFYFIGLLKIKLLLIEKILEHLKGTVVNSSYFLFKIQLNWNFPGGTVVKNPPAKAGDTGSSPGLGRSHMPRSN